MVGGDLLIGGNYPSIKHEKTILETNGKKTMAYYIVCECCDGLLWGWSAFQFQFLSHYLLQIFIRI